MTGARLTRWRGRLLRPLAGLLAANAAACLVYTLPRTLQERSLAQHAAALKNDVERERRAVQRLRERVETIRANARDLESFYREVLKEPEQLASVLTEIDRQAPSTGARKFNTADIKGTAVTRFVVTTPVQGSYVQLVAFLESLERSPHFVTVDRVSLRERDQGAELDVELSLYFRAASEGRRG